VKLLLLLFCVTAVIGPLPNSTPKSKWVSIGLVDYQYEVAMIRFLRRHGVTSETEGSVLHSIWVPQGQERKAERILGRKSVARKFHVIVGPALDQFYRDAASRAKKGRS